MTIGKLSGQCDFGQKGQSYCNQRGQSCVAKRVKVAWLFHKLLCKENKFCPGDVFDYDYGNGHIYNLGTQATWRTRAKIEYIEKALIQMLELASGDNVTAIALPAIGAGLGGLKWDDVKAVLNKVSNDYPNVDLYVVETYQSE